MPPAAVQHGSTQGPAVQTVSRFLFRLYCITLQLDPSCKRHGWTVERSVSSRILGRPSLSWQSEMKCASWTWCMGHICMGMVDGRLLNSASVASKPGARACKPGHNDVMCASTHSLCTIGWGTIMQIHHSAPGKRLILTMNENEKYSQ